jgi:hypothetical protein
MQEGRRVLHEGQEEMWLERQFAAAIAFAGCATAVLLCEEERSL